MRKMLQGLVLSTVLIAAPALAQSDVPDKKSPEGLALEGIDRLMRALDLMLQSIPQYEAPYVNEEGDIIIRRKHPDEGHSPPPIPQQKPEPPGSIPT